MARRPVHRQFYPNSKLGGEAPSWPIAKASPLLTESGVEVEFVAPRYYYTPSELKNLARWLFALSREAETIAEAGLIKPDGSYDVTLGKLVRTPADR